MTTTIEIPDDVVKRAMDITGVRSPQLAVVKLLTDAMRPFGDQADLVPILGTFKDFMTREELDKMRETD